MIGIITALLLLIVGYIYKYYENVRKYPPGPTPYPLIGNLFQFDAHRLHYYLEECHKKYGDIFTVWTPRPMVILMSYDTIKEGLVNKGDDLIGRMGRYPDNLFMSTDNGGVIFSQGENWREQRRTAIHILRDFGMGKNVMEEQVKVSLHEFMNHLNSIEDKNRVDFRWPIQIFVANVINKTLFNYHYPFNDCSRLMNYSDTLAAQIEEMRKNILVFVVMQFPFLSKVPLIGWKGEGQYRASTAKLLDHVREDVSKCIESYDENEEPQSFVHSYMQKMGKTNQYLTIDQMVNVCGDFFLAGMETTSTTLRWAMLHMANNVDVQDKIRAEIHSVLGKDREPSMKDRVNLPYTNASVHEVQRHANILPLNVIHRTVADTKIDGHSIPEDTLIMAQIYNVLRHGNLFKNPQEFRPERFLMDDGKTPIKEVVEQLVPFSMGKRQCAGEGLTRMELFLGLATIIQKYRILPPLDGQLDLRPIEASILLPRTNYLQMIPV